MEWIKSLLFIKPGEERQVSLFILLFLIIGMGMAIGKGSADALFLKRYGIEYLPVMYLILGVMLVIISTIYAAFVDRLSAEKFFQILFSILIGCLFFLWLLLGSSDVDEIYPVYFLLYEIFSELLLVHAAFYIGQNLDTLQLKRLTPLILSGYQLGMIIGGLFLAGIISPYGVQNAIYVWACITAITMLVLFYWHYKNGTSVFYYVQNRRKYKKVEVAVNELKQGLVFIKKSELLKYSSYALFFMVIAYYVLIFVINSIYNESFESEEDLALFFGVLVAVTNSIALILQIFVVNRVTENIGVRKTKMIYPITTLISFLLLLINPGFYVALFASLNKDSIMPAFRNPVRQMFFNILPDYMKGRARATSIAIVIPVSLIMCGLLIIVLQQTSDFYSILLLGLFCAVMYMYFCYKMGNVYVSTLLKNLKERLFISKDISYKSFRGGGEQAYDALVNGLESEHDQVSLTYARILVQAYPDRSIQPLMERIKSAEIGIADQMMKLVGTVTNENIAIKLVDFLDIGDLHFRATVYEAIFSTLNDYRLPMIEEALMHENPRIQSTGIIGAILYGTDNLKKLAYDLWGELLKKGEAEKNASIDLISSISLCDKQHQDAYIKEYTEICSSIINNGTERQRLRVYQELQNWEWSIPENIYAAIRKDIKDPDPNMRAASAGCLNLIEDYNKKEECIWQALDDGHLMVRESALNVLHGIYAKEIDIFQGWLLGNKNGTPRAQKELLTILIEHGIHHDDLNRLIDAKIKYASELLSAIYMLEDVKEKECNRYLLLQVISERLLQTVDLALMALEPLVEPSAIAIIRAGINSKDSRYKANAREALQSLNKRKFVNLLNALIGQEYHVTRQRGLGKKFASVGDVFAWCMNGNDKWLSQCGEKALQEMTA